MIYIFYHRPDLDGHCSGAIARYYYESVVKKSFEMTAINYEDDFPWDKIQKDDTVVMVDFSLQPSEGMRKLAKSCKLIWIDHHKSSLADLGDLEADGLRDTQYAGCELTWMHFFPNDKLPMYVQLLGRYDIWDDSNKEQWNLNILPFQYGMKSMTTDPSDEDSILLQWLRQPIPDRGLQVIRDVGDRVQLYQQNIDASYAGEMAFPVELFDYKGIAMNLRGNSQTFKSVWDPKKYDMMVMFYRTNKGVYTVSFYTTKDDVDCSVIAKKLGGGGHQKSAGCQVKTLPWDEQLEGTGKGRYI